MAKQTFTTGQVLTAAQMTSLQQTAMGGGSPSTKTASYVLVAADAGTTIQMNSSSATTITVNTSLFSAGDSLQIQNIGTGIVTITAGTATVNTAGGLAVTQWDGGFLYFSSTSSAIYFDYTQSGLTNPMTTTGDMIYASSGSTPARLGIGSTGQVLTVAGGIPSWATPSAGGGGKVLQVVQASTTTDTSIASTSYTDTTLSATITPTSSTSKILVMANQQGRLYRASAEIQGYHQILRGATSIRTFDFALNFENSSSATTSAPGTILPLTFLDSPSTTSATTYKVQAKVNTTANSGQYQAQYGSGVSIITLLEIGA